jgi:hypothetical protein
MTSQLLTATRWVTLATLLSCPVMALAAMTPLQSAYWAPHDEIDYLDNLPRTYSCDELYYKYRDILLRVGARPGQIYSYGCTSKQGAAEGTPHVDITYSVTNALPAQIHSNSGLQARLATVRLSPGNPKSLDARDCSLLRDMSQTVLASFSQHIDASRLQCGSMPSAHPRFELVVKTLLPVPTDANRGRPAS